MIINREHNKTRAYFTQTQFEIDIRCPKCVKEKKCLQHCKIFHSLASIWYHIVTEHGEILDSDLKTSDIFETLNNIAWAIEWKMFPSSNYIVVSHTKAKFPPQNHFKVLHNGNKTANS